MALYKENKEFRILSAIGIILVVAGHLGYDVFDIGGLFPYYSFHVPLFMFRTVLKCCDGLHPPK